jgi:hypothetical protein
VIPGTGGDDRGLDGEGDGGLDRETLRPEELVVAEAGVPLTAVGVEDPEGHATARRTGPVAGHDHLGSLADDIAPEADPRPALELESDPGRLANGAGEARGQARRLEDRNRDLRPSGEGRQATEPIGDAAGLGPRAGGGRRSRGSAFDPLRQVDDEEVNRPAREQ